MEELIKKLLLKYKKKDLADEIGISRPTLNVRLSKSNWKKAELHLIKKLCK